MALELHGIFGELDRQRWRREVAEALDARLTLVRERMEVLCSEPEAQSDPLRPSIVELARQVSADPPTRSDGKRTWIAFRTRVQPTYESIVAAMRATPAPLPSLRPTNHTRKIFHVLSASLGLAVLELAPWPVAIGVAAAFFASGWTMEISRKFSPGINALLMKAFGPVAHPHEAHRINSATWYASALLLLSLTELRIPCALGLVALGLGDPAAAMVGRRFGRIKWLHGRTLEGTLAFVVASTAGGVALLMLAHSMTLGAALLVALAASIAGAFAELVSRQIDDNLSVPVMAFVGAALAIVAIG